MKEGSGAGTGGSGEVPMKKRGFRRRGHEFRSSNGSRLVGEESGMGGTTWRRMDSDEEGSVGECGGLGVGFRKEREARG
jgi:hypothetical protein